MDKYEYRIERITSFSSAMSILRDLGLKGWEVCAFNYHGNELLLKREIENEQ